MWIGFLEGGVALSRVETSRLGGMVGFQVLSLVGFWGQTLGQTQQLAGVWAQGLVRFQVLGPGLGSSQGQGVLSSALFTLQVPSSREPSQS